MNRLAETCYPDDKAPRALWAERAWLEPVFAPDGVRDE